MSAPKRRFYVGHCRYGLNMSYWSDCWNVLAFSSRKERQDFLDEKEYCQNTNQYVAEKVTRKIAEEILRGSKGRISKEYLEYLWKEIEMPEKGETWDGKEVWIY